MVVGVAQEAEKWGFYSGVLTKPRFCYKGRRATDTRKTNSYACHLRQHKEKLLLKSSPGLVLTPCVMVAICKDWACARSGGAWPERACMWVFWMQETYHNFIPSSSFHLQVLHAHQRAWKQSLWSPLHVQNTSIITRVPNTWPYLLGALFPCEFSKRPHRPWTTQLVPQILKLSGPHLCSDYLTGFQVLIIQANTKSKAESKVAIKESLWEEFWALPQWTQGPCHLFIRYQVERLWRKTFRGHAKTSRSVQDAGTSLTQPSLKAKGKFRTSKTQNRKMSAASGEGQTSSKSGVRSQASPTSQKGTNL